MTELNSSFSEKKEASSLDKLKQYIYQKMIDHDICEYGYLFVDKFEILNPIIVTNFPENWMKLYHRFKLHMVDPIVNFGFDSPKPFFWPDSLGKMTTRDKKFLSHADKHSVSEGYSFTVHDAKGNFSILSITKMSGEHDFDNLLGVYRAEMQMMLMDIHKSCIGTDY
ncbi:autoinducer binding domain-containing protein [Utexia brackfieldae]|uniref:autoinducer binding domain-containing protein n=1 Tax=Utexia brackfieldae TaxID=3074108 RepID=UPI00370D5AD2